MTLGANRVERGWTRAIRQGPRTIQAVLDAASDAMDDQDEAEACQRVTRWPM